MANQKETVSGRWLRDRYELIILKNPFGDNPDLWRTVHERGTHPAKVAPRGMFSAVKQYRRVKTPLPPHGRTIVVEEVA